MKTNEIKSFRTTITLKEYLYITDILLDKQFTIGNIQYLQIKERVQCQDKNTNDVVILLGRCISDRETCLFERGSHIVELYMKSIIVHVEVVLKQQIKDLKYIEQTNLFTDGENIG